MKKISLSCVLFFQICVCSAYNVLDGYVSPCSNNNFSSKITQESIDVSKKTCQNGGVSIVNGSFDVFVYSPSYNPSVDVKVKLITPEECLVWISKMESAFQNQIQKETTCELLNQGMAAYSQGEYESSIMFYRQYLTESGTNIDFVKVQIVSSFKELLSASFLKEDWSRVIVYGNELLMYEPNNVSTFIQLGGAYWNLKDTQNASFYWKRALDSSTDIDIIKKMTEKLDMIKEEETLKEKKENTNTAGNLTVDAAKYLDNKIITEKTLGTQSDSNTLAQLGIVKAQDSEVAYRLDDSVLRQEVVGMAMKVGKFELPDDYACQRVFADVSATKPNSWACRVIEIAAEKSIISAVNKSFRPMATITRAEALAILLKAANITITESATSHFRDVTVPWQISVINTAFTAGYIDDMTEFRPTEEATRGEIFAMARRILRK